MKKLLVIVDMQYDFVMPDGALYVPGADKLIVPMIQHISQHIRQPSSATIYTMDSHDAETYSNHFEFKEHGFPPHCIKGTQGWSYILPWGGGLMWEKDVFNPWRSFDLSVASVLPQYRSSDAEVEIIGVAADYCVRETLEGFKARGFNAYVNPELTVGINENPYA